LLLAGNRVHCVLIAAAFASAASLSFLNVAPNRLVSGTGVRLAPLLVGGRCWLILPAVVLALACFARPTRSRQATTALAASLSLTGLLWLAGDEAQRLSAHLPGASRVSLGGGFWALASSIWMAGLNAVQRLDLGSTRRTLIYVVMLLPALGLLFLGELDQLALLKEYANRRDVFHAAWQRHLEILLATLVPSLAAGIPLGIAAARSDRFAAALFAVLNVIQTVPSIALFGLLIVPLAWLAGVLPGWGIRGVGLLPAVIALTLYALLPIVRGMAVGLRQVPAAVVEAAAGMGMTARLLFWQVELPLALPILLSSVRITVIQVVGLTVVAALIGAGGFGAIVFQGLAGSSLDQVMLGVLPVVALGIVADAGFRLMAAALEGRHR
jgi:osmoprotectant transport system permease protein